VRLDARRLAQALAHLERGDWQAAHEIVQKDEESPPEAGRAFPGRASMQDEIKALKESL
jgi:hypothetical protein